MLLGLSGKSHSGKDTVADVLVNKFGFKKFSFASPLKEMCSKAFNVPLNYFYDVDLKDKKGNFIVVGRSSSVSKLFSEIRSHGFRISKDAKKGISDMIIDRPFLTPRELLQYVGTDVLRKHISDDIWLTITMRMANEIPQNVVIPDCRFINELEAIKNNSGIIGKVIRPGVTNENARSHVSEKELNIDFDIIFDNSCPLGAFQEQIELWYTFDLQLKLTQNRRRMRQKYKKYNVKEPTKTTKNHIIDEQRKTIRKLVKENKRLRNQVYDLTKVVEKNIKRIEELSKGIPIEEILEIEEAISKPEIDVFEDEPELTMDQIIAIAKEDE